MNVPVDVSRLLQLSHLNRAQKRMFIIRDQLKFLDPHHLDTFLQGVSDAEPPAYRVVVGRVEPPLAEITIQEGANRLDLGNVRFTGQSGTRTRRVHLSIEGGTCEMQESEALLEEDDDLNSVPVESLLVKNVIPLFRQKYEAIDARKCSLNEVRKVAYKAAHKPTLQTIEGKTLGRLNADAPGSNEDNSSTRKRSSGESVSRHPMNKRKRIGLERIPDSVKSNTLNNLPGQVKIDLFNTIVKTALPNFDSLMIASWNVVSVYSGVGSEDKELHDSILELNHVLREFEAHFGKTRVKTEKPEIAPQEALTGQSSQLGPASGRPTPDNAAVRAGTISSPAATVGGYAIAQQNTRPQDFRSFSAPSYDSSTVEPRQSKTSHASVKQIDSPAQRLLNAERRIDRDIATYNRSCRQSAQDNPPARSTMADHSTLDKHEQHDARDYEGLGKRRTQHSPFQDTAEEPVRKSHKQLYADGSVDLLKEGTGTTPQKQRMPDCEQSVQPQPINLGSSKLGAPRKPSNATGEAPVAPMMHNQKGTLGTQE